MQIWQAVVLGLVEGITEYLPVSSTGHLIIASSLLGLDGPDTRASVNAFNIVVQGGAILAVAGLYWQRIGQMLLGLMGRDRQGLGLVINLACAFAPAAVLGFLLDDWIEARLFHPAPVVVAIAVGGAYMLWIDRVTRSRAGDSGRRIEELTPAQAFLIGLLQCIAMWPGTSRSMMTISGGLMVGLRPKDAAEFSFLLGLPTLGAACAYTLVKDLSAAGEIDPATGAAHQTIFQTLGPTAVIVGLIVATVSAAAAVRWLVGFLARHGLAPFAWYRFALALVLGVLLATGAVRFGSGERGEPIAAPPAEVGAP